MGWRAVRLVDEDHTRSPLRRRPQPKLSTCTRSGWGPQGYGSALATTHCAVCNPHTDSEARSAAERRTSTRRPRED